MSNLQNRVQKIEQAQNMRPGGVKLLGRNPAGQIIDPQKPDEALTEEQLKQLDQRHDWVMVFTPHRPKP